MSVGQKTREINNLSAHQIASPMSPIPSAQSHLAPLFAALLLALCPSALLAQLPDADPSLKFHFEELPPGPIVLFPGIDQPPPEFTSNGMVLQFGPYQTTPGGAGSMEAALIDAAPGGIDSPAALFLTGTSALFDLTGANLLPDETITTVAFPLQGDGSGGHSTSGSMATCPTSGQPASCPPTCRTASRRRSSPVNCRPWPCLS